MHIDQSKVNAFRDGRHTRPGVIPNLIDRPIASESEIFATLLRECEKARHGKPTRLQLFLDGAPQPMMKAGQPAADTTNLIVAADQDFDGYEARLRAKGVRTFLLAFTGMHLDDPVVWRRSKELLAIPYAALGMPAASADVDTFVGNNELTNFGTHKDCGTVFSFVTRGSKRMLAWPFEQFAHLTTTPHARHSQINLEVDYRPHRDLATVLQPSGPGDAMYWPASNWHIAESEPRIHVSINVTMYEDLEVSAFAREYLNIDTGIPKRFIDYLSFSLDRLQQSAEELPSPLAEALRLDERSPAEVRSLKAWWLSRVSAFGFTAITAPLERVELDESATLRTDSLSPIVWTQASDDELLCAANGHVMALPDLPAVRNILADLTNRPRFLVGELTARHASEDLPAESIVALLAQFARFRSLARD
jgi:50S ribosomal protein L16 3-hydroxylase